MILVMGQINTQIRGTETVERNADQGEVGHFVPLSLWMFCFLAGAPVQTLQGSLTSFSGDVKPRAPALTVKG